MSIVIAGVVCGACHKKDESALKDNPFMQEWNTPYGVPPFEKIKIEHYLPAFKEGMRQQNEIIDNIVNNTEDPTFGNTIIPLEYSDELLNKVSAVFFNLLECCNSDEMEKLADTLMPLYTQHGDDIMLNDKLFQRVKKVYDNKDKENLNPEQLRLLEETYKGFVRGGANVPADKQARFREINTKLATLTQKFGSNVLKATNGYQLVVDNKEKLAGLTEQQIQNAAELANEKPETKGKYAFTLDMPTLEPFLMNCQDRNLRKEIWTAYSTRCLGGEFDNEKIINEIVNLRLEKANILG